MAKTYGNELAPWEQRSAYYSQIRMEKGINKQTEAISSATKDMIAAHMSAASSLIASQERITEQIDNVGYALNDISQGLSGLAGAFEWGISQVVWQLEQNRDILIRIVEILSAPLDTQAKELKKRADAAYANEWFDDALADYKASEEKNRYDFTIHMSMGLIYLFNLKDKEVALKCFENAAKYAKPKSSYHASFALLHKGLCLRDLGRVDEALVCTKDAIGLTSDLAEAYFQCAIYYALLKHPSKNVIEYLSIALGYDKNYALKANRENAFDYIRGEINRCIEDKMVKNYDHVNNHLPARINIYDKWVIDLKEIRNDFQSINTDALDKQKYNIDRIIQLIKRNSFFDSVEARGILQELVKSDSIVKDDIKNQLNDLIKNSSSDLNKHMYILFNQKSEELKSRKEFASIVFGVSIAAMPLSMVGCLVTEIAKGQANPIFWGTFLGGILGALFSKAVQNNADTNLAGAQSHNVNVINKSFKIQELEEGIEKAKIYLDKLCLNLNNPV